MGTNEIIRRRALQSGGSAVDWESIARGMLDGVTEFEIPSDVVFGSVTYMCYERKNLKGHITFPEGMTRTGYGSFQNCTGITGVTLPSTLTNLYNNTFTGCTGITGEFVIPDNVTTVANNALQTCTHVTSLVIGSSVTTIAQFAFAKMAALTEIVCKPTTPPSLGSATFNGTNNIQSIYVPDASVAAYQADSGWSSFASIIKPISQRPT